ncbi:hypothetical protein [[Pseudomonas] boreopolis]|uniref:hypothetical protein n=1 Tax=Xanthomonas boreopolis TaxID=86183 RepID=UPI003D3CFF53
MNYLGANVGLRLVYTYVAASFYFIRRRVFSFPFAAFSLPVLMFFMFDVMERQVDSEYYEFLIGSYAYRDLWDLIVGSYYSSILALDFSSLAKGSFLLVVYPLIKGAGGYDGMAYVAYSYFIFALSALLLYELALEFCLNHGMEGKRKIIAGFSVSAFMLSPSLLFFSNDLLKDQLSMLLVLLATYLFIKRSYIFLAGALILAMMVRSYNPLIIFLFVMAIRAPARHDYKLFFFFLVGLLFLVKFNFAAMANMLFSSGYVFVNPFPFRSASWEIPINLVTIQGIIMSVALVAALWQLFNKRWRVLGLDRIALSIMLFGCLSVVVGFNNTVNLRGDSYQVGRGGDNMTRKSFPILPLLMLQLGCGIVVVSSMSRSVGYRRVKELSGR